MIVSQKHSVATRVTYIKSLIYEFGGKCPRKTETVKQSTRTILSRGVVDFGSNFKVDKDLSTSWCAAVLIKQT